MTRDGLTEENLRDGSVKDISHKSRGRPEDTSEVFVPERERKKKASEKTASEKGTRLQNDKIRKLSIQNSVLQYEAMRRTADEIRELDSGIVRIGTVSSVSCHWLPGIIRTFWQKHPNIQIVLHQGDYTSVPEWVRTGAAFGLPLHSFRFQKIKYFVFLKATSCIYY